eukprot:gene32100-54523_t
MRFRSRVPAVPLWGATPSALTGDHGSASVPAYRARTRPHAREAPMTTSREPELTLDEPVLVIVPWHDDVVDRGHPDVVQAVGEQLHYAVSDAQGEWVAVVIFAAAALHLRPREQWIGWSDEQRRRRLALVANNV